MASDRVPIWIDSRRPDTGFVGRESGLATSGHTALTQPASVRGLGGVGKTLLAVEFAHRHTDDYDAVLRLAAEDPTALASAFADLSREPVLPEVDQPDQAVRTAAVRRRLEAHGHWLLAFDNAERREDVERLRPAAAHGARADHRANPDWHPLARVIPVSPLPRPDSIRLLRGDPALRVEAEAGLLADGGEMIQVLFLAANPGGTTPLALDEEIRAIDAKIRGAEHRDRLELASHWAVRLDDLSGLLMRRRPDIVHFSGHGAPSGEIKLLAADGTPKPVPSEALAELFRVLKDNVRVVVFNACHSEAQAKAVVRVIDCAVGMSRAIDDDHAIAFAAEFYQALGFGRSVQDAFDLGVARLMGEGVTNAKGLVKLHKRRGINPADLVLVGDEREPKPEPEVGAQPGRPAGQEA